MSDFVRAARTDEVAHVLDDAERRDVELLVHRERATAVGERHLLRRRDDDRARDRHRLAEAQHDVARSGRQIDDQIVEVRPPHFTEELLQRPVQHRPAPDDRRVVSREEGHRDDLHPVLLGRHDLLAVGRELGLQARASSARSARRCRRR